MCDRKRFPHPIRASSKEICDDSVPGCVSLVTAPMGHPLGEAEPHFEKETMMANTNANANEATQTRGGGAGSQIGGKTTIDDAVVAKIAGIAAREVPGVYALGGGAARMVGVIRDALNSTDLTQGVHVEVGERQVAADITIVAAYPAALQNVADGVRAAVHRAIVELVGMEVTEVNVTVNDVHIPSEDDDDQAEERVQ